MNYAYLAVAVFRDNNGLLGTPEIWLGAVCESPLDIYEAWNQHLGNFPNGQEPHISHVLEVNPLTNSAHVLSWPHIEKIAAETLQANKG